MNLKLRHAAHSLPKAKGQERDKMRRAPRTTPLRNKSGFFQEGGSAVTATGSTQC